MERRSLPCQISQKTQEIRFLLFTDQRRCDFAYYNASSNPTRLTARCLAGLSEESLPRRDNLWAATFPGDRATFAKASINFARAAASEKTNCAKHTRRGFILKFEFSNEVELCSPISEVDVNRFTSLRIHLRTNDTFNEVTTFKLASQYSYVIDK